MADKKFSELDLVGSLTGTEILPVIQEGLPKRTTVADVVANYVLKSGDTMTGQLTSQIVAPSADSTYTLGTSSLYWKETYTDKLFLNSTATLDGSTAGTVAITGNVTSTGTGSFTTVTAGTTTDVLGTALTVIRNNVAVGRIDNNASGLRVQAQNGSLQLRGTGNTGISIDASGNAVVAGTITPVQATTAGAPAYVKGAIYFDTTLNKLRVGGASGWETVTSS